MPAMCFQKKDSDRPICGVHGTVLVLSRISIDSNAPGLGHIDCLVCSVSRAVVEDRKQKPARYENLNHLQMTA